MTRRVDGFPPRRKIHCSRTWQCLRVRRSDAVAASAAQQELLAFAPRLPDIHYSSYPSLVTHYHYLTGAHTELMSSSSPPLLALNIASSKRVMKLSAPSPASYSHPAIVTVILPTNARNDVPIISRMFSP